MWSNIDRQNTLPTVRPPGVLRTWVFTGLAFKVAVPDRVNALLIAINDSRPDDIVNEPALTRGL